MRLLDPRRGLELAAAASLCLWKLPILIFFLLVSRMRRCLAVILLLFHSHPFVSPHPVPVLL